MKKYLLWILIFSTLSLFPLSLYGCAKAKTDDPSSQPTAASSAANTESAEPSEAPTDSEPPEHETECNWTLEVSDTVTTEVKGYAFTCTLSIMAVKLGGTDVLGTYRGIVTLDYSYDMQQGNVSGNASGGGREVDAVIEVVAYDAEKYDSAGEAQLAQLIEYDAMAIGSLILSGSGDANETAGGAGWSTAESKTIAVPYRMAIDGGQVSIELYTTAPGASFSGLITGTPI